MTRICKITAALVLLMFPVQAAQSGEHEIAWYGRVDGQSIFAPPWIWIMEADGSNLQHVYETCGPTSASWSPDGGHLALSQTSSDGYDGVFRLDLSDPPVPPPLPCPEFMPPRLLGESGFLSAPEVDGESHPFNELDGAQWDSLGRDAYWSPAGDEIAIFVSGPDPASADEDYKAVVVLDPNDSCAPPPDPASCQSPVPVYYAPGMGLTGFAWSPDGNHFAVTQDRGDPENPQYQIVIVSRENGDVIDGPWFYDDLMLDTANPPRFEKIDWAPETPAGGSRLIAFQSRIQIRKKKFEERIYTLDLEGSFPTAQRIVTGTWPSWSPDAEFIAFRSTAGDPMKVRLSDGAVTSLGAFRDARDPDWKPAGQPVVPVCGNGLCEPPESYLSCPEDCSVFEWGNEAPEDPNWCMDDLDNDGDALIDLHDSTDCCPLVGDQDEDGHDSEPFCGGGDCDDSDAGIHPGAIELCTDQIDNDCNGSTDCDDSACQNDSACETPDCSQHGNKRSCDGDPDCRWNNPRKVCEPR